MSEALTKTIPARKTKTKQNKTNQTRTQRKKHTPSKEQKTRRHRRMAFKLLPKPRPVFLCDLQTGRIMTDYVTCYFSCACNCKLVSPRAILLLNLQFVTMQLTLIRLGIVYGLGQPPVQSLAACGHRLK